MGTGNATVILSLDWKGVSVASTKHTLTVRAPATGNSLPVSTRLVKSLPHPDRSASLWTVRFMPSGSLYAAGYPSGVIQVWDITTGKELRRIESPRGFRGSAEYTSTSDDFRTVVVPIDGRKVIRDQNDPSKPPRVAFEGHVQVWDLTTGKPKPNVKLEPGCGAVAAYLSPDGTRLIAVERTGYRAGEPSPLDVIRMYDMKTMRSWKLGGGFSMAAFAPDGKVYLSANEDAKSSKSMLLAFDRDGKQLETLSRIDGQRFSWPVLSPDNKRLAVVAGKGLINQPSTIKVFDLTTNKEIAEFASDGDYPFFRPVFSPDGKRLAVGDYNGQVTVWNLADRSILRKHKFKNMAMSRSVAFSNDGKQLAVPVRVKTEEDNKSSGDNPDPRDYPQPRVFLFDLTKKGEPEEIVCPHGWAGDVAFAPDGKTLAVGSAGAVHLFDVSRPVR